MDIKDNLAKNLIRYRKALNLTQAELADKLNYSDKAVSKWERGEAVPDLAILKGIADLYGTTIDNLIAEPKEDKPKVKHLIQKKRLIISLIAFGLAWLVGVFLYSLLSILFPKVSYIWLIFIYSIPVSTITFLVFSAVWGKNIETGICISILIWSLLLSIYLTVQQVCAYQPAKLWLIFLIGIPLQVLDILWITYKSINVLNKFKNRK